MFCLGVVFAVRVPYKTSIIHAAVATMKVPGLIFQGQQPTEALRRSMVRLMIADNTG